MFDIQTEPHLHAGGQDRTANAVAAPDDSRMARGILIAANIAVLSVLVAAVV